MRRMQRAIVRAYAREMGIQKVGRRFKALVLTFKLGTMQATKDYRKIEKRRDKAMEAAMMDAYNRREDANRKIEVKAHAFPRACGVM